jgi:transcriptional regulator with XRE-family HTH domain
MLSAASPIRLKSRRFLTTTAMIDLPESLKRLRAASGRTQKQVAAAVGWSVSQINEVENGRAQPSYDLLMKLLELYDATLVILPRADEREFTALDKDALVLIVQAGYNVAVMATEVLNDEHDSLWVRLERLSQAVGRYWQLLASLGIKEKHDE